jgi:hypothetical protein
MAEGYINLFVQDDYAGTNRPHYKGFLKIDGVEHEFALWPAREGKKGFSGKYKPKQAKPVETEATGAIVEEAQKVFPGASVLPDDEIGF